MKKAYKLKNLDCANCAAKMENLINNLDGVNNCKINFMMEKLIIDIDDDKFNETIENAIQCIKKIDSDCEIIL